jgi:predicted transcriptional regulator
MRTAIIRIGQADLALQSIRSNFISAFKQDEYVGEFFDFESPSSLFRVLTPKRWALMECLQKSGSMGVRALARALGRDVKRVHEDVQTILACGLIEKTADGKLTVPFAEIRADFVMKAAA